MSSDNLAMDEAKPYTSSAERFHVIESYDEGQKMRMRTVPDVPEDVLIKEHFNDPNFDIHSQRKWSSSSEIDAESNFESDRYSTDRAESRNSTAIDFDEYVAI
jgi:hypothetical protein